MRTISALQATSRPWAELTDAEKSEVRYEMGSCVDWMADDWWRLCYYVEGQPAHGTYWNCEFPPMAVGETERGQ